jgi:hypothetical protein
MTQSANFKGARQVNAADVVRLWCDCHPDALSLKFSRCKTLPYHAATHRETGC